MKRDQVGVRLNCFSPPVMLATFTIEIVMMCYVIWRYKLDWVGRLVTLTLVFLAIFQLSEYFVCGGFGMSSVGWAKIGYVAITMLPPLGLHLMHELAGRKIGHLVYSAYALALGFIGFFLGYEQAFTDYACTGNYVIFQLATGSGLAYGFYYYGLLMATIGLGLRWAHGLRSSKKKLLARRYRTIMALIVGYLLFMVPTAVANTIAPETRQGIPSVMCGFAVLYALVLVMYITPQAGWPRRRGKA